ncbi:hypothetical protein [Streptomyces sp. NPDC059009]|uniref:hypothetical protein n=1 Tax=Streptomyces sp. NPDC059009 TaxID=3346694 RepID=UPI0036CF5E12
MDITITVRACDYCKKNDRPTARYTLTPEKGEPVTRDLCAEDVAPLEALFGPLVPVEVQSPQDVFKEQLLALMEEHERDNRARRASVEAKRRILRGVVPHEAPVDGAEGKAPAKKTTAKKAPAKETAAKKATPAKKTTAKKTTAAKKTGTRSLTVEEIEAMKAEGKL